MGLVASQVRRRKKPKSPEALEYSGVEGLARLSKSGWLSREQMAVIEFCRRVGVKHGLGISGPAAAQGTKRKRKIEANQSGWGVSLSPKVRYRVSWGCAGRERRRGHRRAYTKACRKIVQKLNDACLYRCKSIRTGLQLEIMTLVSEPHSLVAS